LNHSNWNISKGEIIWIREKPAQLEKLSISEIFMLNTGAQVNCSDGICLINYTFVVCYDIF